MAANVLVPAAGLAVGDVLDYHGYEVRIVGARFAKRDILGRPMIGYRGQIVAGPDRIGDEGELTFGESGVARRLRSEQAHGC